MQLTGTGTIPMPIEGYKLRVSNIKFDWLNGDYSFLSRPEKVSRWYREPSSFCEGDFYEDATWQFLPILNSGVWISGEMPLPEPQEGSLLCLEYSDGSHLIAKPAMGFVKGEACWTALADNGYYNDITLTEYFEENITHWQWISAPKI